MNLKFSFELRNTEDQIVCPKASFDFPPEKGDRIWLDEEKRFVEVIERKLFPIPVNLSTFPPNNILVVSHG